LTQGAITVLTTLALYLAVVVSPGPSFALVSRTAAGERRAALGVTLGLAVGGAFYAVLTMTGMALVLSRIGGLAQALQIAGGLYLIYLGVRTWLDASAPLGAADAGEGADASGFGTGARRGLLMCLSNPKAIAFFVGLYAAAVPPDTAFWAKGAILLGAFTIEVAWYGTVTLVLSGRQVRRLYQRWRRLFERTMGVILAVFGLRLVLSER
jgi:threonine/homoserine/homoserine lactone efflux protein